jgi:hypothetical protein
MVDNDTARIEYQIGVYDSLRDWLEQHYRGEWIVIQRGRLYVGHRDFQEAAVFAVKMFGRGEHGQYLIKEVGAVEPFNGWR